MVAHADKWWSCLAPHLLIFEYHLLVVNRGELLANATTLDLKH